VAVAPYPPASSIASAVWRGGVAAVGWRGRTGAAAVVRRRYPSGPRLCPARPTDQLRLQRGRAGERARERAGGRRHTAASRMSWWRAAGGCVCSRVGRCTSCSKFPRWFPCGPLAAPAKDVATWPGFPGEWTVTLKEPARRGGNGASTTAARYTGARGLGVAGAGERVGDRSAHQGDGLNAGAVTT